MAMAAADPDIRIESAVLHSLNGGGQNIARIMLTGALVGAQTGFSGIPKRFLDGPNSRAWLPGPRYVNDHFH